MRVWGAQSAPVGPRARVPPACLQACLPCPSPLVRLAPAQFCEYRATKKDHVNRHMKGHHAAMMPLAAEPVAAAVGYGVSAYPPGVAVATAADVDGEQASVEIDDEGTAPAGATEQV